MSAPVQLNPCQQAAADAAYRFLLSPDKEFNISGPAGVGKTFLMKHIMQDLLPLYKTGCKIMGIEPVEYKLALTATTNKAAEVLERATGVRVQTIHSFMNLRVADDYDTGVSKITRTGAWDVHTKTIIFIDEASMIDSVLYKHLHEGTDKTCKIVYLGDHCQMAPIFEDISPVYANPKNVQGLKTQMRNSGQPALLKLCEELRANVETDTIQKIEAVAGVIDYVDDVGAKSFIDQTFSQENANCRVLCFTNARVAEYNTYIRALRGYPSLLVQGERVINNTAFTPKKGTQLKIEAELVIEDILSTPYLYPLDSYGAEIQLYNVRIRDPDGDTHKVAIPTEPDHYKALLKFYARQKNWERYFFLKNTYPDLRPRDAATVYKAQGSTYQSVFLDLSNIGTCVDVNQVARMLYVGASRATSRLVLYGQLPDRFFQPSQKAQDLMPA